MVTTKTGPRQLPSPTFGVTGVRFERPCRSPVCCSAFALVPSEVGFVGESRPRASAADGPTCATGGKKHVGTHKERRFRRGWQVSGMWQRATGIVVGVWAVCVLNGGCRFEPEGVGQVSWMGDSPGDAGVGSGSQVYTETGAALGGQSGGSAGQSGGAVAGATDVGAAGSMAFGSAGPGASGEAGGTAGDEDVAGQGSAATTDALPSSSSGGSAGAESVLGCDAEIDGCNPVRNEGCPAELEMQCAIDLAAKATGYCIFSAPESGNAGMGTAGTPAGVGAMPVPPAASPSTTTTSTTACFNSGVTESCEPKSTCYSGECRTICLCDADCDAGGCCSDPVGDTGFKVCGAC